MEFSEALPVETRIRSYQVDRVIGQGGFGIVYQATHVDLETVVAIKEYFPKQLTRRHNGLVQPSQTDHQAPFEDGLERFLREAKRLIELKGSPEIVECRDFFREFGTSYMVMEYVDGVSLSQLLKQREAAGHPFTEADLCKVVFPLLDGLAQVHAAGVFHRDIKPSNILIRRSNEQPVIIDFGAAKQRSLGATKSMAPYTEGYAAPEQVGEGEVGPWTDVYGVGAVMWRMVAGGTLASSVRTPVSAERRLFQFAQGRADPLQPAASIGAGRYSPQTLNAIDDCLHIPVNDRMQDCRQLKSRLTYAKIEEQSGQSKIAPQVLTHERLQKRYDRRNKVKLKTIFAVVLSTSVIGLIVWAVAPNRTEDSPTGQPAQAESVAVPQDDNSQLVDQGPEIDNNTPVDAAHISPRNIDRTAKREPGAVESEQPELSNPTDQQPDQSESVGIALASQGKQQSSWTRGSTKDEVAEVQGTPTGITRYSQTEVWWYSTGTVTFSNSSNRVIEWMNLSGNLRVALKPAAGTRRLTSWTRGSTKDEVAEVQGTPTGITRYSQTEVWWYSTGTVTFSNSSNRVIEWMNLSGNLRVALKPAAGTRRLTSWTRGSTKDEVAEVQGTPTGITRYSQTEVWWYSTGTVTFSNSSNRVIEWMNLSGNLRVQ